MTVFRGQCGQEPWRKVTSALLSIHAMHTFIHLHEIHCTLPAFLDDGGRQAISFCMLDRGRMLGASRIDFGIECRICLLMES